MFLRLYVLSFANTIIVSPGTEYVGYKYRMLAVNFSSAMDLIAAYESDSSLPECATEEIGRREVRQVYLVTYSQADTKRFPTRESFAAAVIASFRAPSASVLHWCCSQESHKSSGVHYHLCLKLNKSQRWLPSKKYLKENYNISVHFSNVHTNYYTAFKYVTKQDGDVVHSENHPDLWNSAGPSTMKAHKAKVEQKIMKRKYESGMALDHGMLPMCSSEDGNVEQTGKKDNTAADRGERNKRLKAFQVSEIVVAKNIKSRTDLLALAHEQKVEGKTDLAEFIVNRGSKIVNEIIATAWEMENAIDAKQRVEKCRLDLLREAAEHKCICKPEQQWYDCATTLLENNRISCEQFAHSVCELLEKGRGKYRNIMLTGPANCGKTFLLNPLNNIFKTFTNPACTSFAWVGAEEAEVLFLNDFRWSPQIIAWNDLLLMLEGQLVHLPAPKSHYAKDMVLDRDTPIFCTSKHPLMFVRNGAIDERESEMMSVRWKVFSLNYQIPREDQKEIPPCPTCFGRLVLG